MCTMHGEGLQTQNSARVPRYLDYAFRHFSNMCNTARCIALSTAVALPARLRQPPVIAA
jgi:hypothetical protein